jgi:hypothetical protein
LFLGDQGGGRAPGPFGIEAQDVQSGPRQFGRGVEETFQVLNFARKATEVDGWHFGQTQYERAKITR